MSKVIDDKVVAGAKKSNQVKEDPILRLTESVKSLYLYRDHYFQNHPVKDAAKKNQDVERAMKETLTKFDEYKGYEIDGARAKYFFLKGKTLNVLDKYVPQAEELLSKAVKLNPKEIDAWNELGECYWKNDDIQQAKNCFTGALRHGKDKISLRNLSMVLRQESTTTSEQRIKNVQEGVEYAKEAVSLDTSDGVSWAILGNAYLSLFFTVKQNPSTLRLCMSSYSQAEKDVIANSNPDLFYNKAVALKYQEEYASALESLEKAISLDPTWETPQIKQEDLLHYLKDLQTAYTHRGGMKAKRLFQMIRSLDMKHLGPYIGGSYAVENKSVKLELIPMKDLNTGINLEKVVYGKVVCGIQDSDCVPFTFCLVDKEQTYMIVTVYNLAKGRGVIIGDAVAIPEPYVTHQKFTYKEYEFDFKSIRVESPLVLVINSRKLSFEQQAGVELSSVKKSD